MFLPVLDPNTVFFFTVLYYGTALMLLPLLLPLLLSLLLLLLLCLVLLLLSSRVTDFLSLRVLVTGRRGHLEKKMLASVIL